jgi:RNA-binding protein YhbY
VKIVTRKHATHDRPVVIVATEEAVALNEHLEIGEHEVTRQLIREVADARQYG